MLTYSLFQPGLAVKIGISDLKEIQITKEIKKIFEDFANSGKPFVIVSSIIISIIFNYRVLIFYSILSMKF